MLVYWKVRKVEFEFIVKKFKSWRFSSQYFGFYKVSINVVFIIEFYGVLTVWLVIVWSLDPVCGYLQPTQLQHAGVFIYHATHMVSLMILDLMVQESKRFWVCSICGSSWCCRCKISHGWSNSSWSWVNCGVCRRKQKEACRNEGKRAS